jgi:uncharacterized protein involved in exopolysaccharide biosynthesis
MESLRPRRLTEFIEILWRRKKLLILMAATMMIATFIAIRQVPNIYESRALIVVHLRSDESGAAQIAKFSSLQQELTSRATVATLVRKHNLYPKAKDTEEAMGALQKAINVETRMRGYYPETPESVSISYRYTEPVKARDVIADLVRIFEQANEQMKLEAGTEARRLSDQITEVEERLRQLGPQRDLDLLRLEYLNRMRSESNLARNQRQVIESSLEALRTKEYELERRVADQRKLIAEQEKAVKAASAAPGATASAAYGQLLIRKTEIEADIKNYSDQYTDKHPKMKEWRNQLAEINRQISRFESGAEAGNSASAVSSEARELRQMQRELTNLERDLDVVRHDLENKSQTLGKLAPGHASPNTEVAPATNSASRTEYDRLLSRYNWLKDKQDSVLKISSPAGASGLMFQVIDAPNLPQFPAAPNRMILQLLALGLALCFGLAIAFAVEIPRMFMINDDRDIEYYLGAPVLAIIPETLTPIERSRQRKLRVTRALLILMLAAALVPAFILLLNRLQIFQMLGNK